MPSAPPPKPASPAAPQEDAQLVRLARYHGEVNWALIAQGVPGRNGKSCRLRWFNQLSPSINKEPFNDLEDTVLVLVGAPGPAGLSRTGPGGCTAAGGRHGGRPSLCRRCAGERAPPGTQPWPDQPYPHPALGLRTGCRALVRPCCRGGAQAWLRLEPG
jgi:hypothetical protein